MDKIDNRLLDKRKEKEICKLYKAGKTYIQIRQILHVSDNTIRMVLDRNGISARPGGGTKGKVVILSKKDVLDALNNTNNVREAAIILNVATNTLYNYISRFEIKRYIKILWR